MPVLLNINPGQQNAVILEATTVISSPDYIQACAAFSISTRARWRVLSVVKSSKVLIMSLSQRLNRWPPYRLRSGFVAVAPAAISDVSGQIKQVTAAAA